MYTFACVCVCMSVCTYYVLYSTRWLLHRTTALEIGGGEKNILGVYYRYHIMGGSLV